MSHAVLQRAEAVHNDAAAPRATVFEAATELDAAFQRGDATIGLLPPDAATTLLHLYERAGEAGVAAAWLALGRIYGSAVYGPAVYPSQATALSYYLRGAETRDRDAIVAFVRATHFAHPEIGEPYYAQAANQLNALLEQDSSADLLVLAAWMLHDGQGYAQDDARARAMLEVAAAAGNPDAHFELYVYDSKGIGGPANPAAALTHLQTAADSGHVRAMANLGGMYATGAGLPQDEELSVSWYRRAADAGHPRAAFNLAVMYGSGNGAPLDPDLSAHYRRLAAELGYHPN